MFIEVGKGVAKGSVQVGNDGCILPSPVFVGKDGEETLDECLVHVHPLCIVLLDCHVSLMTVLATAETLSSYVGASPGYVIGAG